MKKLTRRNIKIAITLCVIGLSLKFVFDTLMFYSESGKAPIIKPVVSDNGRYVAFYASGKRIPGMSGDDGVYRFDRLKNELTVYRNKLSTDTQLVVSYVNNAGNQIWFHDTRISSKVGFDTVSGASLSSKAFRDAAAAERKGKALAASRIFSQDNETLYTDEASRVVMELQSLPAKSVFCNAYKCPKKFKTNGTFNGAVLIMMSEDGATVLYHCCRQLMLYDRNAKRIRCVTANPRTGRHANNSVRYYDMTPDGRFVVFVSQATNLTKADTPYAADVFLFERDTGKLICASNAMR